MMDKCPCYDGDFNKCTNPGAVSIVEIKGYKDDPPYYEKRCVFQLYVGHNGIILSNFTREQFNNLMKETTLCTY